MKAERSFRRTILLTALTGLLAYTMAASKPGLALVGVLAAALSAWLVRQTLAGKARPLPRLLLNGLVVAAIAHLVLQLIGRVQEPITSLTDFLAYVMIVKSLDRARMRDEAQLLGLSLFVVIGALLTGQSLSMGLALIAYTPLAITATVQLQLHAAVERQRDLLTSVGLQSEIPAFNQVLEQRRSPRATAAVAAVCAVASMGAGVFAFVITPRQLAQQLGMSTPSFLKGQSTAFSDTIRLGEAGNISEDGTPVIDLRIVSGVGATGGGAAAPASVGGGPIYLRGAVLTRYRPRTGEWLGPETDRSGDRSVQSRGAQFNTARHGVMEVPGGKAARLMTEYEIVQRNARAGPDQPLFAPLHPVLISTEARGQIFYSGAEGVLRLSPSPGGRIVYKVKSATDYIDPDGAGDVIEGVFSPRIRELARSILAERGVNTALLAENPAEVRRAAQAVVAYFSTFPYTLETFSPREGQDPIEMFLFDTRQGHCEYFAAGAAALLSSAGVPVRIVSGYAAAEFNPVTGYYTVRKSDAHAWIEVRMPTNRWETFDPTPPAELQSTRRASGGPIGWVKHLWDAIEFSWLDNVVAYDKGIKIDVAGLTGRADPGAAAARWHHRLSEWQDRIERALPQGVLTRSLLVGAVTFALVLGVFWSLRFGARVSMPLRLWLNRFMPHRRRADAAGIVVPPDAAFYADALDALRAADRAKPRAMPPLTFAEALPGPAGDAFAALTHLFYRSRFGGQALPPDAQAHGREALRRLRRALGHPVGADGPRT